MSLYSVPAPKGYRALPTGLLTLDDRSGNLITTGKYQMPLPTTDAELVAQGWPSIAGAVDGDLWLCDEAAGNLIGEINGYQLAPQNAPLQDRDFHGLPYGGNLWAKKAVETIGNTNLRFDSTAAGACDIGVEDFTVSWLLRPRSVILGAVECLFIKLAATGYQFYNDGAFVKLFIQDAGGWSDLNCAPFVYDGALHLITISIDRNGNIDTFVDGNATVSIAAARPGTLSNAALLGLCGYPGVGNLSFNGQCAWAMINIGTAATRAGHDALWAALNSDWLGTDNTYARTGPLTYPISAARVATTSAGVFMPGYAANASAGDNALKLGVVCEDGITFEPIGSNNLLANYFLVGGVGSIVAADGPSGMRDAVRVQDNDVAANAYGQMGPVAIVGASNVPWEFEWMAQNVAGAQARVGIFFTGDAGGAESLFGVARALGAAWARYADTLTPVRAGQTNFYPWLFSTDAVPASVGTVDFSELSVIKNRATASLAWRRVGTAAAAATGTPSLSYTNVGNARYSPARGRIRLRISDFTDIGGGRVFLSCGVGAGAVAGGLMLDYTGGNLRLRIWDNAVVQVASILCGAVTSASHEYIIEWDATIGKIGVFEGSTVLGSFAGTWVSGAVDVTPIAVGTDTTGANACHANVELLNIYNY